VTVVVILRDHDARAIRFETYHSGSHAQCLRSERAQLFKIIWTEVLLQSVGTTSSWTLCQHAKYCYCRHIISCTSMSARAWTVKDTLICSEFWIIPAWFLSHSLRWNLVYVSQLVPSGFSSKYYVVVSCKLHACFMYSTFNPCWLNHPDNIRQKIQVKKFLVIFSLTYKYYA
jgi:hypothetical protein